MAKPRLRIFISSPGDVIAERRAAALIINDRLAKDFARYFAIEAYLWEYEPMLASGHFQDVIDPPSACDIVVTILWSRLGSPLPEQTEQRSYRGIDDRAPVTGTEWEFEDALASLRGRGAPDLLVYRKTEDVRLSATDEHRQDEQKAELAQLTAFWQRYFAERGQFKMAFGEFAGLDVFADKLERDLRAMIEQRVTALAADTSSEASLIWFENPFRGLLAYEVEHAPIFFGRADATSKAIGQLTANAQMGRAFLLILGASGSGKSSLAKAGIVPALGHPGVVSGVGLWRHAVMRPDQGEGNSIDVLAEALITALPELLDGDLASAGELAAHLRTASPALLSVPVRAALKRVAQAAVANGSLLAHEAARLVIVVDQLEELYVSGGLSAKDRQMFVAVLWELAASGHIFVVATMRADFWHRASETPLLLAMAEGHGRLDILRPSPAELAEMIRRPAEAAGVSFEIHHDRATGLDAEIAEAASHAPGALPLLSVMLEDLYRNDVVEGGDRVLRFATYEELGRLTGAIAARAERVWSAQPPDAQTSLAAVLRSLVTVSRSGADPTSQATPLESFASDTPSRRLVDSFLDPDARLLVASGDGQSSMVRLAHEALLTHWKRAHEQVAQDRRDLETRARLEEGERLWREALQSGKNRDASDRLLRGLALAEGQDLLFRWGTDISRSLGEFIGASTQAERNRRRRVRAAVAAIVLGLAVLAGAATWFGIEADEQRLLAKDNAIEAARLTQIAQDHARELDVALHAAQVEQARSRANKSNELSASGNFGAAIAVALSAMPHSNPNGWPDLEEIGEVLTALTRAMYSIREHVVLRGHATGVYGAMFSPDGSLVVTISRDDTARIWDALTGREIAVLEGHERWVQAAAFSPDGARLVTASWDSTARIWDVTTGEAIAVLGGHQSPVRTAVFSPDGAHIVTASWDNTARVWDVATGKQITLISGHDGSIWSAAFSPDGSHVVTASDDQTVRLWDAVTGKAITVLQGHEGFVYSAVFSPDGNRIASASGDGTARIWDVETGNEITIFEGHYGAVDEAIFSPDGERIVTTSDDGTARVWDVNTGDLVFFLRGHERKVKGAAYSSDGTHIVTASSDGTARIWDAATGEEIAILRGHRKSVRSAVYSPNDAHVLTASLDGTARIWSANAGSSLALTEAHGDHYGSNDFSPYGSLVDFSPDGMLVAAVLAGNNTVRVWNALTGSEVGTVAESDGVIADAKFLSDSLWITSALNDGSARIWDAFTREEISILRGHSDLVVSVSYSPDSARVVTASKDGTARIWDVSTGDELVVLYGSRDLYGGMTSAAFSPDGVHVVTGSKLDGVRIWDASTGSETIVTDVTDDDVHQAAYSPDGKLIVAALNDGTARVLDAASGSEVVVLAGHLGNLLSAAFSPDGSHVVTAASDRTVRLWNAVTGEAIVLLRGHEDWVQSAVFSPEGAHIASASADHTVWIWPNYTSYDKLYDAAREVVDRIQPLTDEESCLYRIGLEDCEHAE